jgi:hypothetical protein
VPAERELRIVVHGGVLVGQRGGTGAPALLLHAGPAVPDYTEGCARELHGSSSWCARRSAASRRRSFPGPYSTETHRADALAVLDAVGHSWGGHLRATFVIDPDGVVRHVSLGDLSVGRSLEETLRVVQAFQTGELCQAGWRPGSSTVLAA